MRIREQNMPLKFCLPVTYPIIWATLTDYTVETLKPSV